MIALLLALLSRAPALTQPEPGQLGETVVLGPAFTAPVLPLGEPLATALAKRAHATAVPLLEALDPGTLHGHQVPDRAFLLAWERLRTDDDTQIRRSITDLDVIRQSDHAPEAYLHLTVGELLLKDGRHVEGARELALVPADAPIWARARLQEAEAWRLAGGTAEALEVWESLAARPDPASGSSVALMALAVKSGIGSPEAYPYLRRLWVAYPYTKEGAEAAKSLAAYESRSSRYKPSLAETAARGTAMMDAWQFQDATDFLGAHLARFATPDTAACEAWYAFGRSHFKRNNVTKAAEVLGPAGRKCAGIDEDRGARSLYVAGKALERKKLWADAAREYEAIPELYPGHTMADDGYTLAGVAWQVAGDTPRAMRLWEAQVDAYPTGDLGAEAFWRLAWSAYLGGDTAKAVEWAERMIWEVPIQVDPVHVMAGKYWSARWRIYPDHADPTARNPDEEQVAVGVERLAQLCREHPTRFYAILAASRLAEVAPWTLAEITRPAPPPGDEAFTNLTVRAAFLAEPAVARAVPLARLGLMSDALAELDTLPEDQLTPSEVALLSRVQEPVDWVTAHDRLHHYLLHHPPSTLGADRDAVLRLAYPDRYWDLVQAAANGYRYDPRVFHALVREESSFNKDIVSFAGARGLSQLMPGTARDVAGWLGIKVTDAELFDPAKNLQLGARYLEYLAQTYDGNMFLAVAGYNAGPGNVNAWLRAAEGRPTDEWIESIPIRETRGYVKRVLGTYQLYRTVYDPGPLFPDFSRFNHDPQPDE